MLFHPQAYKSSTKQYLHIFITILFIFILFNVNNTYTIQAGVIDSSTNRYIIQFNQESFISQLIQERKNDIPKSSMDILDNITAFQSQALKEITAIVDNSKNVKILQMFHHLFNGITITGISERQRNQLIQLNSISNIFMDNQIILIESNEYELNQSVSYDLNDIAQEHYGLSGKNISIAIFDTGIDYTHPAILSSYYGGYDFVHEDTDPMDDHGHGTHCAGIIAGNYFSESSGIRGIAPNASIYAYKVMDETGKGYTSWFLEAFEAAIDPNKDGNINDHMDIISISAGQPDGNIDDLLSIAADQAVQIGIVVVAAAGNEGPQVNTINSPACAEHVIAVGASVDPTLIAPFSSRGSPSLGTVKPDIIAPGFQINSTWLNHEYRILSGTSMATPYVAGMCSWLLEEHPSWTPLQITHALRLLATDIGYNMSIQGYGYLAKEGYSKLPHNLPTVELDMQQKQILYDQPITGKTINGTHIQRFYYQKIQNEDTWHLLYEKETHDDLFYYVWQTQFLSAGYYCLKLEIEKENISIYDISYEYLSASTHDTDRMILAPSNINEGSTFTCQVNTEEDEIVPSVFLFIPPFHLPQIRFGMTVSFHAPVYYYIPRESINATLLCFSLNDSVNNPLKTTISIYNT